MRKLSQYPLYISVGFVAIGFLVLFLAWNVSAEYDHVPAQIPVLISGGLTGMGLIGVGLTMAVTAELRRTIGGLRSEVEELANLVAAARPVDAGPASLPTEGEHVVTNRTTYHDPECRIVRNRPDLQPMDPAVAAGRGLTPCRVCQPVAEAS